LITKNFKPYFIKNNNKLLALICLALSACMSKSSVNTTDSRPNVIFIVADDMNGYGVKKQYPNSKIPYLDKFEREAINFTNAVCNMPVCSPSRTSFFSGLLPSNTGAYRNGAQAWTNSESGLQNIECMPECFKRNGYKTWGGGKIFHNKINAERFNQMWDNKPYTGGFGPFPEDKNTWLGGTNMHAVEPWTGADTAFTDVIVANQAVQFLQGKHEKPFFLYYGLYRPHFPCNAPQRFFDLYDPEEIDLPKGYNKGDLDDVPFLGRDLTDSLLRYFVNGKLSEEKIKRMIRGYLANYSFADWNIGRVIEALDKSDYADNTIVVFCSDNGFHMGEKFRMGKATLWEPSAYVPLMIRIPGQNGYKSQATASLVDIYPTLVDYCRINPPKHKFDGHSMDPFFENKGYNWEWPGITIYNDKNYTSVRSEKFRYIQYPDGSCELYDMENDPYEFINIAENPDFMDVIKSISTTIPKEWKSSLGGKSEIIKVNPLINN
jgi:arylsulfatase A-like enzyme